MDAEQRFIIILSLIGLSMLSLVTLVLLVVLWSYRIIIGFILITLVLLVFLLIAGIVINEGVLRHKRVKYHSEMPLSYDDRPFPFYQGIRTGEGGKYD